MRLGSAVKAGGTLCTLMSFLAACSSPPGNLYLPAAEFSVHQKSATAYFVITVPHKSSLKMRPHFVSPATKSIAVTVSTLSGKVILTKKTDLTPKSHGCVNVATGTQCTITGFSLTAGSYEADVTAYSRTKERGNVLSVKSRVPFSVGAGARRKIGLTMDGVPAAFEVVPTSPDVSGSIGKGFTIGAGGIGGSPQTFLLSPLDANGDAIVGAGSPTLSIATSNAAFSVAQPVAPQQSFTITPPPNVGSASTQLTVKASFPDKSVCAQRDALCSSTVNLSYAPFAADDWIAFAHDFQRTGWQRQNTGISPSTVSTLKQRWKVTLPESVYSSLLSYRGNVIVPGYKGTVYDLSAVDGSVIWKTTISTHVNELLRSSPAIDVEDGLVLMGTWYNSGGSNITPKPSTLYALRLSDGSVAWSVTFNGLVHASPVYADGVVYEGWSGGDEPYCINGGVSAINAKTGVISWTWLTNPFTNPGGGGGVWGPLSWDGSHIVFGTGNTCQGEAWDEGAVALNADGSMAWHFQADPTYQDDNDTGGGIMLENGVATFLNKNGSLYTLDETTGRQLAATALGGFGGHGTATSDGSTIVVGAGFFPVSSSGIRSVSHEAICKRPRSVEPGFMSYLKGINTAGQVLWSLPMTDSIDSYAAIDNGVAFEGMDAEMDAIALTTGTILWQVAGSGTFHAGPAVVPSGLYIADYAGNVSAFSLH